MDVVTGTNGMGLRWARSGDWRLVAYAEGGCCIQRRVPGVGFCLLHDTDAIPSEVEDALLCALGMASATSNREVEVDSETDASGRLLGRG